MTFETYLRTLKVEICHSKNASGRSDRSRSQSLRLERVSHQASSFLISAINAPAGIRLLLINVNNFYSTFQEVEKALSLRPQDSSAAQSALQRADATVSKLERFVRSFNFDSLSTINRLRWTLRLKKKAQILTRELKETREQLCLLISTQTLYDSWKFTLVLSSLTYNRSGTEHVRRGVERLQLVSQNSSDDIREIHIHLPKQTSMLKLMQE